MPNWANWAPVFSKIILELKRISVYILPDKLGKYLLSQLFTILIQNTIFPFTGGTPEVKLIGGHDSAVFVIILHSLLFSRD